MMNNLTINMMVKNEKRYIFQTLRAALPFVSHAIIVDTGSTDGTREIIKGFCEKYPFIVYKEWDVSQDSIKWDGNHLNEELTKVRNWMLEETKTDWVWQLDGDEIYTPAALNELYSGLDILERNKDIAAGIMVPIKWCVSDEEYVHPGPFPKTLRVMKKAGVWKGKFPDEFLYIDDRPVTIYDNRCITLSQPFLHMSMALHEERRPKNGIIKKLTEDEKERLCLKI